MYFQAFRSAKSGKYYFVIAKNTSKHGKYFTAYVVLRRKHQFEGDQYNNGVRSQYFIFGGPVVYPTAEWGLRDFWVHVSDLLFLDEIDCDTVTRVTRGMAVLQEGKNNKFVLVITINLCLKMFVEEETKQMKM